MEAWMHAIRDACREAPGFVDSLWLGVEHGSNPEDFEVLITFDSAENFRSWEESDIKRELYSQLDHIIMDQKIRKISGLEPWLGLVPSIMGPPPKWKMALLAFMGVYPTIAVTFFFLMPLIKDLPMFVRLLCTTPAISLIMTFLVMPALTKLCHGWLFPQRTGTV